MGLFDIELTAENQSLVELYNRVIDPKNQSIDWQSYMMFCYLEDFPNWRDNQDIILHIRDVLNNYRNKRSEQKVDNNSKSLNNGSSFEKIKKVNYD